MPRGRRRTKSTDVLLRSAELVGWALGGLEREIAQTRERLAALNAQAAKLRARAGASIRATLGTGVSTNGPVSRKRRRRGGMTAAGRKRISDMMKKRWAEAKKKNRNRL
jgi:hypothetical protein